MGRIVVVEHLTLDGVMQAPGRADEDTRGGFAHGGWAVPYQDAVMGRAMGQRMAGGGGAMLFGRRTYEDFFKVWPGRTDNPFTPVLTAARKYVASMTLSEPLPWENSVLLKGDLGEAVRRLKVEEAGDIAVLGSGGLVQSLLRLGLVDTLLLTIHPLVLGSGGKLFADDGTAAKLKLVESKPTTTGVIIATYEAQWR